MKRFILYARLKPDKREEYVQLHKNAWPEIYEVIAGCNFHNYSISIRGDELDTYFEYSGVDYDADKAKMDNDPAMKKWHIYTKPCFIRDENGNAYEEMQEIFYSV